MTHSLAQEKGHCQEKGSLECRLVGLLYLSNRLSAASSQSNATGMLSLSAARGETWLIGQI
jgi:hypothetical protein